MKTMFLAAAAALSLGIGSAYAAARAASRQHLLHLAPWRGRPGSGAERPGRRDGAERAGGARLRHPVEPRHVAVPAPLSGGGQNG